MTGRFFKRFTIVFGGALFGFLIVAVPISLRVRNVAAANVSVSSTRLSRDVLPLQLPRPTALHTSSIAESPFLMLFGSGLLSAVYGYKWFVHNHSRAGLRAKYVHGRFTREADYVPAMAHIARKALNYAVRVFEQA